VLEFILEHIGTLDETMGGHTNLINNLTSITGGHTTDIEDLKKKVQAVKDKNDAQDV